MNRLSKNEEKLRQQLNNKEFEYNPDHWAAAQKILDAKQTASAYKFKAIWLTLPVLIITAGIIRWAAPETTTALSKNEASINTTSPIEENTASNNVDETVEPKNSVVKVEPQTHSRIEENISDSKNTDASIKNQNMPETKLETGEINTKDSEPRNENNTQQKQESPQTAIVNEKPLSEKPSSKENIVVKPNKNLAGDDKKEEVAVINTNTPPENTVVSETVISTEKPEAPKDIAKQAANTNSKTSGESKKEEEQNNIKPPKQILVKNSFSVLAGTNYSRLIEAGGSNYINTPYLGLQYQYQLNQKWQLNAGLGYSYVNANGLEKQYSKEQYSFGLTTETTTINTDRLHYIELPVLARYKAFNNISIVGGANVSYLLNTNSTIDRTRSTTLGGKQVPSQTKESLYKKGLSPFDIQLQLGIEYKINNNLHIGLLANSGLFDVSRNNYYNTSVFNRNSRLQLYIKYDFIRF
jgi:hypothetical protein